MNSYTPPLTSKTLMDLANDTKEGILGNNDGTTGDMESMDNQSQLAYDEAVAELFWKLDRKERRKVLKKNAATNWTKYVYKSLFKPKS